MMKVIVDELPDKSKDCIFAEYIGMTSKYKCMFQSGMYSRCNLDCGKECPYLKRGAKEPSISAEEEIGEKIDAIESLIQDLRKIDIDITNKAADYLWDYLTMVRSEKVEI